MAESLSILSELWHMNHAYEAGTDESFGDAAEGINDGDCNRGIGDNGDDDGGGGGGGGDVDGVDGVAVADEAIIVEPPVLVLGAFASNPYERVRRPLRKVICGGQRGADLLGVIVAQRLNIPTGGYVPMGYFREELGNEWARRFQFVELAAPTIRAAYVMRTQRNIADSEGTLVLRDSLSSAGTNLTINICHNGPYISSKKPAFRCDYRTCKVYHREDNPYRPFAVVNRCTDEIVNSVCAWIIKNQIRILNIAGPRALNTKLVVGTMSRESFLQQVFERVQWVEAANEY